MLTLIWLFYFVDGSTVLVCLFVIYAQTYLITGEKESFLYILSAFFVYALAGLLFCQLIKRPMTEFMFNLANEQEMTMEPSISMQANASGGPAPEPQPKEKKNIEIPEFLFKYSSTFFKTATKKDVLFKKLFSPQKDGKLATTKTFSDRYRPNSGNDDNIKPIGKIMKKTDHSMVNFHLDVKGNDELMKQYR